MSVHGYTYRYTLSAGQRIDAEPGSSHGTYVAGGIEAFLLQR